MTLHTRVTVAVTAAVFVSVLSMSFAAYSVVRHELLRQVDQTLAGQGEYVSAQTGDQLVSGLARWSVRAESSSALFRDAYLQVLDREGQVMLGLGPEPLPVTEESRRVAAGGLEPSFEDVDTPSGPVRTYTVPTASGAFRFGTGLGDVHSSLRRLMFALIVIGSIGTVAAAVLGRAIATRAIAPVHGLSAAAHTIKQTGDLSHRLPVQGRDEVASLAASFNDILEDLDRSQNLQRQLVADASHELRTPLTTLRTNIELLARGHDMTETDRRQVLDDLSAQILDLTGLVGDLVDLARDEAVEPITEAVRLDEIARDVVERARRQRPHLDFVLHGSPTVVQGSPERLDRAISNLVDNAAKWSPADGRVLVRVSDGTVSVLDNGPGIAADDLPHVFDRFYRSPDARQMPGSGLGLAIVKQISQSLGGTVSVASPPGGGTELILRLPPASEP